MVTTTLHYVHDPLCGWCYAAAPLLRVARGLLPVEAHGGGMMAGSARQQVTPQLRAYIVPADQRITQMTGQPFGAAWHDGLLADASTVLDSGPPTTAMLAAAQLGTAEARVGRDLDLLARMQQAQYVEGRRLADPAVLRALAADIGLDSAAFAQAYEALAGAATDAHINESRRLLARLGGRGFPTFALERDGQWAVVDTGAWLGRAGPWGEWLAAQVGVAASAG
jgi:putative protein-disulfide isomerase